MHVDPVMCCCVVRHWAGFSDSLTDSLLITQIRGCFWFFALTKGGRMWAYPWGEAPKRSWWLEVFVHFKEWWVRPVTSKVIAWPFPLGIKVLTPWLQFGLLPLQ